MAFWGKNQINGQPGQRPMPNVTARNGGGPQAPAQQPAAAPQAAPKKNSLVDSFNQLLFLKKKNPVMILFLSPFLVVTSTVSPDCRSALNLSAG